MMYKRIYSDWKNHIDFIMIDAACQQVAFILAYMIRFGTWEIPYFNAQYWNIALVLLVANLAISIFLDTFRDVVIRDSYEEFILTVKQAVYANITSMLFIFISRLTATGVEGITIITTGFHIVFSFWLRCVWKKHLDKHGYHGERTRMLLVTEKEECNINLGMIEEIPAKNFEIVGVSLVNYDPDDLPEQREPDDGQKRPKIIGGIDSAEEYILREWVDEVLICLRNTGDTPSGMIESCREMGVPVHTWIPFNNDGTISNNQFIEELCTGHLFVVTNSWGYVTPVQMLIKRIFDILGGLVGSFFAIILIAIFGPIIKHASPGPILYKSTRIGKNGKRFSMYKIRSMYPDAEARKKELMEQNNIASGLMFKMDWDPRIIGNRITEDGKKKTGIGEFLRKSSIDEFPQFFNVLLGDMSLVGTRPPTPDEWDKYKFHHRARLSVKPGLTGMWQVSGRSKIKDFEQVVKLDMDYINNWSFGMDLRLLLRTVVVVLKRKGAI